MVFRNTFNPLNAKLNPICHLLALLGAHPILHVSRIRVKLRFSSILYSLQIGHTLSRYFLWLSTDVPTPLVISRNHVTQMATKVTEPPRCSPL